MDSDSKLCEEFHKYRVEGVMGDTFGHEITTLELTHLDGTPCEAVHGIYSRLGSYSSAAKYRSKAPLVRFGQHMSESGVDGDSKFTAFFSKCWYGYKAVLNKKKVHKPA